MCVCLYVCIYVFVDMDLLIPKFKLEFKGPRITKIILNKKNQAEGFLVSNIKTYYTGRISKPAELAGM